METVNLCTCNNCNAILIDNNPKTDAIKYNVPYNAYEPLEQISVIEDGKVVEVFWGCPNCQTDGYLNDDVNVKELFISTDTDQ